jgi:hypothetical protein
MIAHSLTTAAKSDSIVVITQILTIQLNDTPILELSQNAVPSRIKIVDWVSSGCLALPLPENNNPVNISSCLRGQKSQ